MAQGLAAVVAGSAVLRGAAVMAVVAFLVNDSGLVIPAFVALVLAPLLVASGAAPPVSDDVVAKAVAAEQAVAG